MHYKNIQGKEFIARTINDFTLDNSQWIYHSPLWIADAIGKLKIPQTYQYYRLEDSVVDYSCDLPVGLELLIAVEYNGYRLRRLGAFNNLSKEGLEARGYSSNATYEVANGESKIITSFETGDIVFHFRAPASDLDTATGIIYPRVPADPYVIEAIQWYVLMKYLQKGYKHPLFNLTDKNEATNPFLAWELAKKRARNSVNIIDADEKEEISKLNRAFLLDLTSHDRVFFDNLSGAANMGSITYLSMLSSPTKKYKVSISGLSTLSIPYTTHRVGEDVIPTLFVLVGDEYIPTVTQFNVDTNGDVEWVGGSVVTDGYIIIM